MQFNWKKIVVHEIELPKNDFFFLLYLGLLLYLFIFDFLCVCDKLWIIDMVESKIDIVKSVICSAPKGANRPEFR